MLGESKGMVIMLLSALLQGSHGLWANLIGLEFGAFYQGWTRSAIILLILVPLLLLTRSFTRIEKGDKRWYALFVGFMILSQAPLFYAFNTIGLAATTTLFLAAWLITNYLIGGLFLQETFSRPKIIALLISISGLLIFFSFSLEQLVPFGMLMALMTGFVSAAEVAFTKKVTHKYSTLQITTFMWLGIFLTHLPLAYLFGEQLVMPTLSVAWLYHVGYACSIMLAFGLAIYSFKYIEASIGGLIGLFVAIFGAFFGVLLVGEELTSGMLIGGALIAFAALLPQLLMWRSRLLREVYATPRVSVKVMPQTRTSRE